MAEEGILDSSGQPFRKKAGIGLGFSVVRAGSEVYLKVPPSRAPENQAEQTNLLKLLGMLAFGKGFPLTGNMAINLGKALKNAGKEANAFKPAAADQVGGNGSEGIAYSADQAQCLKCNNPIPCECMTDAGGDGC